MKITIYFLSGDVLKIWITETKNLKISSSNSIDFSAWKSFTTWDNFKFFFRILGDFEQNIEIRQI